MKNQCPYKLKPASRELTKLYALLGEALCAVQLIEDALSYAIAMKKDIKHPNNASKAEADSFLAKYRKHTLGDAIKLVEEGKLLDSELRLKLKKIKEDRNWLIHRSFYQTLDSSPDKMSFEHCKDALYVKIKTIVFEAHDIQHAISEDLLRFSEDVGLDMSSARKAMERYYQ